MRMNNSDKKKNKEPVHKSKGARQVHINGEAWEWEWGMKGVYVRHPQTRKKLLLTNEEVFGANGCEDGDSVTPGEVKAALLKKIMEENLTKMVEKCKLIATQAHKGQVREFGDDEGKPYVVHTRRVADAVDELEEKCVAHLHDVIEDTTVTRQDLFEAGVPDAIIVAVEAMSKKRGECYFDFIKRVACNPWAREVKKADIRDNMMSLKEGSLKDKYRFAIYFLEELY